MAAAEQVVKEKNMESLTGKVAAAALALLAMGALGVLVYQAAQSNTTAQAMVLTATQNAAQAGKGAVK
jgi:uncharacterized membrane protein YebE (DUF533 family)